jgi:hypothetical protein
MNHALSINHITLLTWFILKITTHIGDAYFSRSILIRQLNCKNILESSYKHSYQSTLLFFHKMQYYFSGNLRLNDNKSLFQKLCLKKSRNTYKLLRLASPHIKL